MHTRHAPSTPVAYLMTGRKKTLSRPTSATQPMLSANLEMVHPLKPHTPTQQPQAPPFPRPHFPLCHHPHFNRPFIPGEVSPSLTSQRKNMRPVADSPS